MNRVLCREVKHSPVRAFCTDPSDDLGNTAAITQNPKFFSPTVDYDTMLNKLSDEFIKLLKTKQINHVHNEKRALAGCTISISCALEFSAKDYEYLKLTRATLNLCGTPEYLAPGI
ncbi:hypothetical protein DOY81_012234 [Sarcophaga bullata]|nr:hypothetical protein DOY81_012234 [Sarcophaga bullata]